jgi:hypothetical protein
LLASPECGVAQLEEAAARLREAGDQAREGAVGRARGDVEAGEGLLERPGRRERSAGRGRQLVDEIKDELDAVGQVEASSPRVYAAN